MLAKPHADAGPERAGAGAQSGDKSAAWPLRIERRSSLAPE